MDEPKDTLRALFQRGLALLNDDATVA